MKRTGMLVLGLCLAAAASADVTPALYCPGNNNTRGQMAVFITKTFNLQ